MRLLADENVPRTIVDELRARKHDVAWVRTDHPGARDVEVLTSAASERRVLLTRDKDFGELAFRLGVLTDTGIVLIRLGATSPALVAQVVATTLESRDDWAGHFSVIDQRGIRMTRLRQPPEQGGR